MTAAEEAERERQEEEAERARQLEQEQLKAAGNGSAVPIDGGMPSGLATNSIFFCLLFVKNH